MKILLVKLTSMGDVLHLLPAVSDIHRYFPGAQIDWLVEAGFAEIPRWHPAINRVITVNTRGWRKFRRGNWSQICHAYTALRAGRYDYVIDAQGLIKSGLLVRLARLTQRGRRVGFNQYSVKEPLASKVYDLDFAIPKDQHAITRLRKLLHLTLGFPYENLTADQLDYGIQHVEGNLAHDEANSLKQQKNLFLFHATTRADKHLPLQHWQHLAQFAIETGFQVYLCWASEEEHKRALLIAGEHDQVTVLPKLTLSDIAQRLSLSNGHISVDTGLGHLAAGLGVPGVSVYLSTDQRLIGATGRGQYNLQASESQHHAANLPSAQEIWQRFTEVLGL